MLCDIEVSNFSSSIMKENISRFNISMNNVRLMKFWKALEGLIGYSPNILLFNSHFWFEACLNFMREIPSIGKLHDNAKFLGILIIESLPVRNNVGVVDGGQNPNLIQSIIFLPFLETLYFDLGLKKKYHFYSVNLMILKSFGLEDSSKRTFSKLR